MFNCVCIIKQIQHIDIYIYVYIYKSYYTFLLLLIFLFSKIHIADNDDIRTLTNTFYTGYICLTVHVLSAKYNILVVNIYALSYTIPIICVLFKQVQIADDADTRVVTNTYYTIYICVTVHVLSNKYNILMHIINALSYKLPIICVLPTTLEQ